MPTVPRRIPLLVLLVASAFAVFSRTGWSVQGASRAVDRATWPFKGRTLSAHPQGWASHPTIAIGRMSTHMWPGPST
jgi:hypothetical protein